MRYLQNVTPADLAAMNAMEENQPETLIALRDAVATIVTMRRPAYADDVNSLATQIAPRLYRDDVNAAAGAAVAMATANVDRAYLLSDWDVYGDMTEETNHKDRTGDTRTTLSQWSPRPDTIADASPRDYVQTLATIVPGMATLADYWTRHDADACPDCHDGAGRRVTPRGIVAHMEGFTATTDKRLYHRARRHAVDALEASRPVMAELLTTYAPSPAGAARQGRQIAPKTPATRAHGDAYRTVAGQQGDHRDLTPAEAFAVAYPACRAMASHRDEEGTYGPCSCPATARYEGEEYGTVTAPYASPQSAPFKVARPLPGTGDAVTPGQAVPGHKPVVSPRKRPGSNTGPTIPARF